MTFDFAHTTQAESNRRRKAHKLACAARDLGLQPYELAPVNGPPSAPAQRARVRRLAGITTDPSVQTWQITIAHLEGLARAVLGSIDCPACGWPVLIVRTEAGRNVHLDPFPNPDGNVHPIPARGGGQRARILTASSPRPTDTPLYRRHTTTCPQRPQALAARGRVCTVCGEALYAPLADKDPTYTAHPTCVEGGEL